MPQFARALDVYQGYNFKKDKQQAIGYITQLELGGTKVTADQETIKDPENPDKALPDKVVAILNHYLWETGTTDAMYFSGQISTANKQVIGSMLLHDWVNTTVKVKYVIYEYDPLKKVYFKSNFADAELEGLLEKNGHELNIAIADDPSTEVQSPMNFTIQLGVKPAPKEQSVNVATSHDKKIVKQWGITETGG